MKKMNKKGFTIVELVIVIAVIAILAAVLIPTFSGVIDKANKNSAMQAARNEYTAFLAENAEKLTGTESYKIQSGKYWFEVKDGQFDATALETEPTGYAGTADLSKYDVYTKDATAKTTGAAGVYQLENGAYVEKTSGSLTGDTYTKTVKDFGADGVKIFAKVVPAA